MATQKYTEKVVTGDALQFTGNNRQEMMNFCSQIESIFDESIGRLRLYFAGMEMVATDWIVKTPIGAFEMWNNTQFNQLYALG
jgi:hypothetical protein